MQEAADQIVTTGRPAPRAGLAFRRPTGDERAELEGLIRQHQRGKEVADAEEGGRRRDNTKILQPQHRVRGII